jgi:luciferase family oxidoreductase group 1
MMTKRLTDIRYSILELDVISEGLTPVDVYRNSLLLAQEVEKQGYYRFWLAEHHNAASLACSATPVLIGHIAGGTNKIRVGSGGVMLPNHSPLIVAEQFGTLATLYPQRVDLGLGRAPGTDQTTAHAIRSDRMQAVFQFPEEIEKIQRYFSSSNRHAQIRAVMAEGVEVPLYILGSSTNSAHLAAKKGLPYAFASHFAGEQLFDALDIYRANFCPSSELGHPYVIAGINVIVAETKAEAEKEFSSLIKMFYNVLSGVSTPMQPGVEMTDELRKLAGHPLMKAMLKYTFVGTKEEVRHSVQYFLSQTNADELMVVTNVFDPQARMVSYQLFSEIMREI